MPPTGSTFTDWEQVQREDRLLMNEDFSWSEPPRRSRRREPQAPVNVRRRITNPQPVVGDEGWLESVHPRGDRAADPGSVHSHFDELMAQWNAAHGDAQVLEAADEDRAGAFDLSDPGVNASGREARRTVVITGRGDARYLPAPRRRPSSGLRFHERSGFSPDRTALWAVLLGVALLIGCIAH